MRVGDTLVVAMLDRLTRSLPDARDIADELTRKGVALSLGASVCDPVGRLLFNVLGMVAKFKSDLILDPEVRAGRSGRGEGEGPAAREEAQTTGYDCELLRPGDRARRNQDSHAATGWTAS